MKGYMNNVVALENWFKQATKSTDSTAWKLSRGLTDQHGGRSNVIYKQDDAEMATDESFALLQQMIEASAAGGGEFTIYVPTKSSTNQGFSQFYKVESPFGAPVTRSGLGNFPMAMGMGMVPADEVERRLQQEKTMWELNRKVEELEGEHAAKVNFGQAALGQLLEDGTIGRVVESLAPVLGNFLAGLISKIVPAPAQPATVSMAGFGDDAAGVPADADHYDPERIGAFLNKIRPHFNSHEEMYTFLDKVSDFFVSNPTMSKSMFK